MKASNHGGGFPMRVLLISLLFLLVGSSAFAQHGWYPNEMIWGLAWSIGVPDGQTKDFVGQTSLRGFGIEGRKFHSEKGSVGLSFYWNVLYEKEY